MNSSPAGVLCRKGRTRSTEAWTAVRYVLVGAAAGVLYLAVALFLRASAGIGSQSASAVGVTAAAIFAYLGHHRLTFAVRGDHGRYAPRFFAMVAAGYLVSFVLIRLLVETRLIEYGPATLAIAAVNATLSYLANRLLVFRTARLATRLP